MIRTPRDGTLPNDIPDLSCSCWYSVSSGSDPCRSAVAVPGGTYRCTRREGHSGRHAAGTGWHIVAVWG